MMKFILETYHYLFGRQKLEVENHTYNYGLKNDFRFNKKNI